MPVQKLEKRPAFSFYWFSLIFINASILAFLITRQSFPTNSSSNKLKVESAFYPLDNADLLQQRKEYQCRTRIPKADELLKYPGADQSWNVDRFAAYYNIYPVLKDLWSNISKDTPKEEKPKILEFGHSFFLNPFRHLLDFEKTKYPEVDIHRTPYPDNSFDLVASDQVLEHVIYPPVAMLEMKRILKPGGLAALTTVAYNPVHRMGPVGDYWRFMPDSLKVLSIPFEGGIKACGAWGTSEVIRVRAKYGLGSLTERKIYAENRTDFLTKNDVKNVMLVWLVVQK